VEGCGSTEAEAFWNSPAEKTRKKMKSFYEINADRNKKRLITENTEESKGKWKKQKKYRAGASKPGSTSASASVLPHPSAGFIRIIV